MLINEIILENFMSYEYARIPLNNGLNVVCGPNGAGKSSILLAISVAMGQVYTERGKKLSDLIRWGADSARVTLVLNNRNAGQKTIPTFDGDFYRISRYLNKDGDYWYEANYQAINKSQVIKILRDFGINSDNMLIIMHQHMMTEFGITSAQRKLMMVEEAVGLGEYRQHVLEAQTKLSQVLSEEESVINLLKNAEETLTYWQGEYDRYQQRKELLIKKEYLQEELAWARVIKQEQVIEAWREKAHKKERERTKIIDDLEQCNINILEEQQVLNDLHNQQNTLYKDLLSLEKKQDDIVNLVNDHKQSIHDLQAYENTILDDLEALSANSTMTTEQANILKKYQIAIPKHEVNLNNYFKSNQVTNLSELQMQVQLIRQEAVIFNTERMLLEQLLTDKEATEQSLAQDKKRLTHLIETIAKTDPLLKTLDDIKSQISTEESHRASLLRELKHVTENMPSALKIRIPQISDSVHLATQVSVQIESEIESRNNIQDQINNINSQLQALNHDQQEIVAEIQVCVNEINKITKQQTEINLYLEGKREKPNIKCDKCGSLLTPDQWMHHLTELDNQLTLTNTTLSRLRERLKQVQEQIKDGKNQLEHVTQEAKILERIQPLYSQIKQLCIELQTLSKTLNEQIAEKKALLNQLNLLIDSDKSKPQPDHIIEQKARDIHTELNSLQHSLPRLEKEFTTYEDRHIIPQGERVAKAYGASMSCQQVIPNIVAKLRLQVTNIESELEIEHQHKRELKETMKQAQSELNEVEEKLRSANDRKQEIESKKVLLDFRKESINKDLDQYAKELTQAQEDLEQLIPLAQEIGSRKETDRTPMDISSDIKVVEAHLSVLKDVSEDVEQMYLTYLNLFNELKEKAEVVTENREKTLKEVEDRKNVWSNILESLLNEINPTFNAFLGKVGATGHVQLMNIEDFEMTGLEILVGFKGAELHVLDSRTHSGGEKSSTTMAFLLALQRHVRSPFRAVDEFDVHMDPRNRELVSHMLLLEVEKDRNSQYLTITPGQLTNVRDDIHVITVQRVEGKSEITVAAHNAVAG